jgi:hypothetical protein
MYKFVKRMHEKGNAMLGIMVVVILFAVLIMVQPLFTGTLSNNNVAAAVLYLENQGYTVWTAAQWASITSTLSNIYSTAVSTNTTANTINTTTGTINTTLNSVALDAEYTEEHLHHKVHWYGKKAVQTTALWADGATLLPYTVTSGNNTWSVDNTSDVALLFGTGDVLTELGAGILGGDFGEILITANSSDTVYKLRGIWGTGTSTEAVTTNQFSENVYMLQNSDTIKMVRAFPTPVIPITMGGLPVKLWMSCWNATNDATLSFMIGVHGYDF